MYLYLNEIQKYTDLVIKRIIFISFLNDPLIRKSFRIIKDSEREEKTH